MPGGFVNPPLFITGSGTSVPEGLSPPAKVLVLGCIDPRFASFLEWFLTHQKNIFGQYDLFTLAGASLGFNQSKVGNGQPSAGTWNPGDPGTGNYENNATFLYWDEVFINHLDIAVSLHQITDVWIFDHLDCGAYKIIKFNSIDLSVPDDDILPHSNEINRTAGFILSHSTTNNYNLKVKGFVMNTYGDIYKVYDDNQGGLELTPETSSKWWILPTVIGSLVVVYLYFKLKKLKF